MPVDIDTVTASLRDAADTLLTGVSADVRAARRDVQAYIAALVPEIEVAITEAAAAAEGDRKTWLDTLQAQVDAVALRTLRKSKAVGRALEKRIRDVTLAVLLTVLRLAA